MRPARRALALLVLVVPLGCGGSNPKALYVDIDAVSIFLFRSPAAAHQRLQAVIAQVADPKAKIKVVGNTVVSYSGLRLATEPNYITSNGAKIEGCITHP